MLTRCMLGDDRKALVISESDGTGIRRRFKCKNQIHDDMLSVEEATDRLLQLAQSVVEVDWIMLEDAMGRILAADVRTPIQLPPFDNAAMDGYAIVAGPRRRLRNIGQSRPGKPFRSKLEPDEAVRIMTGAKIPLNANTVVIQEQVAREGDMILADESADSSVGRNIRRTGEDFRIGSILARRGDRISPIVGGTLSACGASEFSVFRRVRVGVFSTGDELQDPHLPLETGQIYDSNRFTLFHMADNPAVSILNLGRLSDDLERVKQEMRAACRYCDVILTSGGVSVGDSDHVRDAIKQMGSLDLWRVALKPGKPLAVGSIDDTLVIGVPGNPVSAIVIFLLFVAPAIDKVCGATVRPRLRLRAQLADELTHTGSRREFQRGRLSVNDSGALMVRPASRQGSNMLSSFQHSNCLIDVPGTATLLRANETVWTWPLDRTTDRLFEQV